MLFVLKESDDMYDIIPSQLDFPSQSSREKFHHNYDRGQVVEDAAPAVQSSHVKVASSKWFIDLKQVDSKVAAEDMSSCESDSEMSVDSFDLKKTYQGGRIRDDTYDTADESSHDTLPSHSEGSFSRQGMFDGASTILQEESTFRDEGTACTLGDLLDDFDGNDKSTLTAPALKNKLEEAANEIENELIRDMENDSSVANSSTSKSSPGLIRPNIVHVGTSPDSKNSKLMPSGAGICHDESVMVGKETFIRKATEIQRCWRGFRDRRYYNILRLIITAALTIQRYCRGMLGRAFASHRKAKIISRVTKFQAFCRMTIARRLYLKWVNQHRATTQIQCLYRGYKYRCMFFSKRLKSSSQQMENLAIDYYATRLQSFQRMIIAKRSYAVKKREHDAAITMQVLYRGFNCRRRICSVIMYNDQVEGGTVQCRQVIRDAVPDTQEDSLNDLLTMENSSQRSNVIEELSRIDESEDENRKDVILATDGKVERPVGEHECLSFSMLSVSDLELEGCECHDDEHNVVTADLTLTLEEELEQTTTPSETLDCTASVKHNSEFNTHEKSFCCDGTSESFDGQTNPSEYECESCSTSDQSLRRNVDDDTLAKSNENDSHNTPDGRLDKNELSHTLEMVENEIEQNPCSVSDSAMVLVIPSSMHLPISHEQCSDLSGKSHTESSQGSDVSDQGDSSTNEILEIDACSQASARSQVTVGKNTKIFDEDPEVSRMVEEMSAGDNDVSSLLSLPNQRNEDISKQNSSCEIDENNSARILDQEIEEINDVVRCLQQRKEERLALIKDIEEIYPSKNEEKYAEVEKKNPLAPASESTSSNSSDDYGTSLTLTELEGLGIAPSVKGHTLRDGKEENYESRNCNSYVEPEEMTNVDGNCIAVYEPNESENDSKRMDDHFETTDQKSKSLLDINDTPDYHRRVPDKMRGKSSNIRQGLTENPLNLDYEIMPHDIVAVDRSFTNKDVTVSSQETFHESSENDDNFDDINRDESVSTDYSSLREMQEKSDIVPFNPSTTLQAAQYVASLKKSLVDVFEQLSDAVYQLITSEQSDNVISDEDNDNSYEEICLSPFTLRRRYRMLKFMTRGAPLPLSQAMEKAARLYGTEIVVRIKNIQKSIDEASALLEERALLKEKLRTVSIKLIESGGNLSEHVNSAPSDLPKESMHSYNSRNVHQQEKLQFTPPSSSPEWKTSMTSKNDRFNGSYHGDDMDEKIRLLRIAVEKALRWQFEQNSIHTLKALEEERKAALEAIEWKESQDKLDIIKREQDMMAEKKKEALATIRAMEWKAKQDERDARHDEEENAKILSEIAKIKASQEAAVMTMDWKANHDKLDVVQLQTKDRTMGHISGISLEKETNFPHNSNMLIFSDISSSEGSSCGIDEGDSDEDDSDLNAMEETYCTSNMDTDVMLHAPMDTDSAGIKGLMENESVLTRLQYSVMGNGSHKSEVNAGRAFENGENYDVIANTGIAKERVSAIEVQLRKSVRENTTQQFTPSKTSMSSEKWHLKSENEALGLQLTQLESEEHEYECELLIQQHRREQAERVAQLEVDEDEVAIRQELKVETVSEDGVLNYSRTVRHETAATTADLRQEAERDKALRLEAEEKAEAVRQAKAEKEKLPESRLEVKLATLLEAARVNALKLEVEVESIDGRLAQVECDKMDTLSQEAEREKALRLAVEQELEEIRRVEVEMNNQLESQAEEEAELIAQLEAERAKAMKLEAEVESTEHRLAQIERHKMEALKQEAEREKALRLTVEKEVKAVRREEAEKEKLLQSRAEQEAELAAQLEAERAKAMKLEAEVESTEHRLAQIERHKMEALKQEAEREKALRLTVEKEVKAVRREEAEKEKLLQSRAEQEAELAAQLEAERAKAVKLAAEVESTASRLSQVEHEQMEALREEGEREKALRLQAEKQVEKIRRAHAEKEQLLERQAETEGNLAAQLEAERAMALKLEAEVESTEQRLCQMENERVDALKQEAEREKALRLTVEEEVEKIRRLEAEKEKLLQSRAKQEAELAAQLEAERAKAVKLAAEVESTASRLSQVEHEQMEALREEAEREKALRLQAEKQVEKIRRAHAEKEQLLERRAETEGNLAAQLEAERAKALKLAAEVESAEQRLCQMENERVDALKQEAEREKALRLTVEEEVEMIRQAHAEKEQLLERRAETEGNLAAQLEAERAKAVKLAAEVESAEQRLCQMENERVEALKREAEREKALRLQAEKQVEKIRQAHAEKEQLLERQAETEGNLAAQLEAERAKALKLEAEVESAEQRLCQMENERVDALKQEAEREKALRLQAEKQVEKIRQAHAEKEQLVERQAETEGNLAAQLEAERAKALKLEAEVESAEQRLCQMENERVDALKQEAEREKALRLQAEKQVEKIRQAHAEKEQLVERRAEAEGNLAAQLEAERTKALKLEAEVESAEQRLSHIESEQLKSLIQEAEREKALRQEVEEEVEAVRRAQAEKSKLLQSGAEEEAKVAAQLRAERSKALKLDAQVEFTDKRLPQPEVDKMEALRQVAERQPPFRSEVEAVRREETEKEKLLQSRAEQEAVQLEAERAKTVKLEAEVESTKQRLAQMESDKMKALREEAEREKALRLQAEKQVEAIRRAHAEKEKMLKRRAELEAEKVVGGVSLVEVEKSKLFESRAEDEFKLAGHLETERAMALELEAQIESTEQRLSQVDSEQMGAPRQESKREKVLQLAVEEEVDVAIRVEAEKNKLPESRVVDEVNRAVQLEAEGEKALKLEAEVESTDRRLVQVEGEEIDALRQGAEQEIHLKESRHEREEDVEAVRYVEAEKEKLLESRAAEIKLAAHLEDEGEKALKLEAEVESTDRRLVQVEGEEIDALRQGAEQEMHLKGSRHEREEDVEAVRRAETEKEKLLESRAAENETELAAHLEGEREKALKLEGEVESTDRRLVQVEGEEIDALRQGAEQEIQLKGSRHEREEDVEAVRRAEAEKEKLLESRVGDEVNLAAHLEGEREKALKLETEVESEEVDISKVQLKREIFHHGKEFEASNETLQAKLKENEIMQPSDVGVDIEINGATEDKRFPSKSKKLRVLPEEIVATHQSVEKEEIPSKESHLAKAYELKKLHAAREEMIPQVAEKAKITSKLAIMEDAVMLMHGDKQATQLHIEREEVQTTKQIEAMRLQMEVETLERQLAVLNARKLEALRQQTDRMEAMAIGRLDNANASEFSRMHSAVETSQNDFTRLSARLLSSSEKNENSSKLGIKLEKVNDAPLDVKASDECVTDITALEAKSNDLLLRAQKEVGKQSMTIAESTVTYSSPPKVTPFTPFTSSHQITQFKTSSDKYALSPDCVSLPESRAPRVRDMPVTGIMESEPRTDIHQSPMQSSHMHTPRLNSRSATKTHHIPHSNEVSGSANLKTSVPISLGVSEYLNKQKVKEEHLEAQRLQSSVNSIQAFTNNAVLEKNGDGFDRYSGWQLSQTEPKHLVERQRLKYKTTADKTDRGMDQYAAPHSEKIHYRQAFARDSNGARYLSPQAMMMAQVEHRDTDVATGHLVRWDLAPSSGSRGKIKTQERREYRYLPSSKYHDIIHAKDDLRQEFAEENLMNTSTSLILPDGDVSMITPPRVFEPQSLPHRRDRNEDGVLGSIALAQVWTVEGEFVKAVSEFGSNEKKAVSVTDDLEGSLGYFLDDVATMTDTDNPLRRQHEVVNTRGQNNSRSMTSLNPLL